LATKKKKKKKPTKLIIAGVAYVLMFASAAGGLLDRDSDTICGGKERWEVKVLADNPGADDVKTKAKIKTIEELNDVSTDAYEIKRDTKRQDLEKQVYTVKNCFITHAILEKDNDIHLVIEDGNKHSMVAEIPSPSCKTAKQSEFINDFRKARKAFMEHKKDYDSYLFDITGVMFIDKEHAVNPTGNADNNVELHPVIKLKAIKKIK